MSEYDKAIKILHKNHFCKYILDYEDEEEDLFHDVSHEVNSSVQSSYWEIAVSNICCITRIKFWNFGADDQYKKKKKQKKTDLL